MAQALHLANGTTINTTYTFAGGPAAYALEAKGSANPLDTSLNGITGLTLNASNLLVNVYTSNEHLLDLRKFRKISRNRTWIQAIGITK